MHFKIPLSTGVYGLPYVPGRVRRGTSTNSSPPPGETITLTTSTLFNWLENAGRVVIYPRESTALLLTDWGTVDSKV